jgi:hypothetical protein
MYLDPHTSKAKKRLTIKINNQFQNTFAQRWEGGKVG